MNILDQTDRTILCNSVSEMAASLDGADFAATMTAIAEQELIGALVSEAAGGMDLDLVSVAAIAATLARFHLRENFVDAILAAQVAELIEPEVCAALLNGKKTVDYKEMDAKIERKGVIAVQIHAGPPSEAWYKDISIQEL